MSNWWQFAAAIITPDVPAGPGAPTPTDYMDYNDNFQSVVNSAGSGAVIGMNAGTYSGFSVTPLTNQKFVAVGNVILDGNGASHCFNGHNVRGVEIWGQNQMNIRDYSPSMFHGAICSLESDWYNNPPFADGGWLVDGVDVGPVSGWGACILTGNDVIIRNFVFHDIGDIGFKVIFGNDGHVHDGEIYNIDPTDWGNEGGGSKNWGTRRLVMEDIYLHNIDAPGLWSDMDNIDTVYRRITLNNVRRSAIFHEISGPCIVEDCIITGDPSWYNYAGNGIWSRRYAGITIANSGTDQFGGTWDGAIVRNNQLEDMYIGIHYIDQSRTDQFGQSRTNTTEGDCYGNYIDHCRYNGAAASAGGTPPVNWYNNTLVDGSNTQGV